MAKRPVFYVKNNAVWKDNIEFEWFAGFSISQKRKSINSLHQAICEKYQGAKALEISTKSLDFIGNKMSAFNLMLDGCYLENVFQSSKVFEKGGPYLDLLNVSPRDAKRDIRLRESGHLIAFEYNGYRWPLEPKTVFYDYLYYQAVKGFITKEELLDFRKYMFFTDIEFNPEKSINTQARSAGIVRLMLEIYGELLTVNDLEEFIKFHKTFVRG